MNEAAESEAQTPGMGDVTGPGPAASVLVVGAGPVGLASATMLAGRGVPVTVLERRPSLSDHPRARLVNARTMEILRRLGLEGAVREAALPPGVMRSYFGTDLRDPQPRYVGLGGDAAELALSPTPPCLCSQDRLEPILLAAARERGAEVRFATEVTSVSSGDGGAILGTAVGEELRGRFVLAADGVHSPTRGALGIPFEGEPLQTFANILFRAPLGEHLEGRESALYHCAPGTEDEGTFLAVDNRETWLLNVAHRPEYRPDGEGFDAAACAAMIRRAGGIPDLPVEVLGLLTWSVMAAVADDWRAGQTFLLGDAAHSIPPSGGFGMNTGIGDADNLAWKIAATLEGWAGPSLLPTYATERRPVAIATAAEALANWHAAHVDRAARDAPTHGRRPQQFRNVAGVLGHRYQIDRPKTQECLRFSAHERRVPTEAWKPTAMPGDRAPHIWLDPQARHSVLDLFGDGFVLVTANPAWVEAAGRPDPHGAPLRVEVVPAAVAPAWTEAYEADRRGAVLIRPDGHIAWRFPSLPDRLDVAPARALASAAGHH